MTSINLRPDDSGVQSLKKENTSSPLERAVSALSPVNRTQPVTEYPETPPQNPAQPVYTGPERRRGERRKSTQPVILDTRDKRERRRNAQPAAQAEEEPRQGIDVYG
jgi:hypothetical protein